MRKQTDGEISRFDGHDADGRWKVRRRPAYFPKPKAVRYRQVEVRNERMQPILHMGRKGWKRSISISG